MKKKIFAVLLAGTLAVSLAACSGDKELPSGEGSSAPSASPAQQEQPKATLSDTAISTADAQEKASETESGSTAKRTSTTGKPAQTTKAVEKTTTPRAERSTAAQNAQKTASFTFSQTFPLEISCYGAQVQILSAEISSVKMTGAGCSFNFACRAKRLADGLGGEKSCVVRIKWLDENGREVKSTTAGIGLLAEGETGQGNTAIGMKRSEMQSSPNNRFTVVLEGYGSAQ